MTDDDAPPLTVDQMAELRYLLRLKREESSQRAHADARAARYQSAARATSCQGKHGFATWHAANGAIHGRLEGQVMAYHCRYCTKWHLGSQEMKRGQRKEQLRMKGKVKRDRYIDQ